MRKFMFASSLAVAILLAGSWLDLSHAQKTAKVPAAARQELMKAAKAHKVSIRTDKIAYVDNQKMTIVRAPIVGIDKYGEADFEKGAPIELVIVKAKTKLEVPDGSYVVKVQYARNATSGKTIFTDAAGNVVAQLDRDGPKLTLSDPDVVGSGHGDALEPPNCAIFMHMFPQLGPGGSPGTFRQVCAECACTYLRLGRSSRSGVSPDAHDPSAFSIALIRGLNCASSTHLTCP